MNQTEQVTSSQNVSFLLFSSPDPPVLGSDELNIYNFPRDNSSANIWVTWAHFWRFQIYNVKLIIC